MGRTFRSKVRDPTEARPSHDRRSAPSTVDHFWDDNGSIHEADINRVADARITLGCAAGEYCPTTTREQMAAFLHRALTR